MFCELEKLRVYYETAGAGRPLLMLHGYGVDHHIMKGCMEPVFGKEAGWERIYLDLPGMGRTSSADWLRNSDQLLQVVLDFIQAVLPGREFAVAGESYGGYLARGLVQRLPERIAGLLLICPCIIAERARRDLPKFRVLESDPQLMAGLGEAERAEFAELAVVQSEVTLERFRAEVVPGIRAADEAFLTRLQRDGFPFSCDVDRLAQPFDKPALILAGRQDPWVGYRDAWRILENFPRASFAVLDKAGHNLQIEQAEIFELMVREWLARMR
jgi:pimeloyl-ACP methyl ester carboxylesterase